MAKMTDYAYYNTLDSDYKTAFLQMRDNVWRHDTNTCRSLQVYFYLALRRDASKPFPKNTGTFCSKPKMTDEIIRMLQANPIKMIEVDPIHAHQKIMLIENAPRPPKKTVAVAKTQAIPEVQIDRKVFVDLFKIASTQLAAMDAEGKTDPKSFAYLHRPAFQNIYNQIAEALANN
jgi:hypothetical protein